jgi:flavodoxin
LIFNLERGIAMGNMKKLVIYFSMSGTTKKRAQELAELTGADLYEIVPAKAYSKEDLNWVNKKSRCCTGR